MSIPGEDVMLACRYGDLEDLQTFVKENGALALTQVRDDNQNTILHMLCANGHLELLDSVLPLVPSNFLAAQNESGSTPLHWAALNMQLEVAQKLVQHPGGPGRDLIDIKNKFGRSPLGEAEMAGWDEGAKWFVEMMNLDAEGGFHEQLTGGDPDFEEPQTPDIEVEIQDADGRVAQLNIRHPDPSVKCETNLDRAQLNGQSTSESG